MNPRIPGKPNPLGSAKNYLGTADLDELQS
jgi:hypothetical protein